MIDVFNVRDCLREYITKMNGRFFHQTVGYGLFYALVIFKPNLCLCMDIFLAATVLISNCMLDLLCKSPDVNS